MLVRQSLQGTCLLILWAACGACAETAENPREAAIVTALTAADAPLLRSRPELVAGKYDRMASDLYAFYRGSVPLFAADYGRGDVGALATALDIDGVLPVSTGDAHPENFGLLLAGDGTLAFEPNDFDGADRYPYLWDVSRLTTGLVLAARLSNPGDAIANGATRAAERDIAAAALDGYAEELARSAAGGAPERVDDDRGNPNLADLFRRGSRDLDRRDELAELTMLDGTSGRRLRRGVLDPEEPTNVYLDVPRVPRAALPATLARYRRTLIAPPPAEFFTILDAARELGSGVASWPRVRVIVLVRGETDGPDDDVLLEVKELSDSASSGWLPPGHEDDTVTDRVLRTSRRLWARPDAEALWGVSTWMGLSVQIRAEREAHKTLRVSRMEDEEGTVDALAGIARILGTLLARMHASAEVDGTSAAGAISASIDRNRPTFVDRLADAAVTDADRAERDWSLFAGAVQRRGPTLGWHRNDDDAPSAELVQIFGLPRPR